MLLLILEWTMTAMSLIGNVFIVRKNVVGQWIWATTNIGWVSFNLYHEHYGLAALFAAYTGMCVWGIIEWSKGSKPSK